MRFIYSLHQNSHFFNQVMQLISLPTIANVLSSYLSHLPLAHDIYLSSSTSLVLAAIIWPLVLFHLIIFLWCI
ncbi:hypothetical protein EDB86DRAFT_2924946 [Lactarius hatsudake]|nr:hypothetical protein EDB86DRAFT_2924946 [Lactarius hatsudake]